MIEKEQKVNKLHELFEHWNDHNLNGIASLLCIDIALKTAPVKVGNITLAEKEFKGKHHVLKYWKEILEKYSFGCKNYKIVDIKDNFITALVDHPEIKISAKCNIMFNKNGQISHLDFYKVLELGLEKEANVIPLMARLVKNRWQRKFGKL